jgi:hypothetical protein
MGRVDDDSPRGGIHVDLAGLHDFAREVRGELDKSMRPQIGAVFTLFGSGVCFGQGLAVSPTIQAARTKYHGSLDTAGRSLAAIVNTADAMVNAIEEIAHRYGDSDWFAHATAQDVSAAFVAAMPQSAEAAPTDPTQAM